MLLGKYNVTSRCPVKKEYQRSMPMETPSLARTVPTDAGSRRVISAVVTRAKRCRTRRYYATHAPCIQKPKAKRTHERPDNIYAT